jgi:pimeloyl-ACP methyl ester carboxylesterase
MRPASLAEHSGIEQIDYERLRADARRPDQSKVRAECFWAMREGDLRGKLKSLDLPSLVIWGMEDNTVPLRDASALVEEWPDIDLRILPKVSHWPQFEAPEVTRRYIRAFLGTPLKLIQAIF